VNRIGTKDIIARIIVRYDFVFFPSFLFFFFGNVLLIHWLQTHKKFRATVRKFVEEELKPHVDEVIRIYKRILCVFGTQCGFQWIKTGYPPKLHERAYELGIQVERQFAPDLCYFHLAIQFLMYPHRE
jgi:hypothetical protein